MRTETNEANNPMLGGGIWAPSADELLAFMETDTSEFDVDLARALHALVCLYKTGPELADVEQALTDDTPVEATEFKRLRLKYTSAFAEYVKKFFIRRASAVHTQEGDPTVREYQRRRRKVLQNFTDKSPAIVWKRAVELVLNHPDLALDIYKSGLPTTRDSLTKTMATVVTGKNRNSDQSYLGLGSRVLVMTEQMRKKSFDQQLDDEDLKKMAAQQFGGIRLLLIPVIAIELLNAACLCANLILLNSDGQYRQMLDEIKPVPCETALKEAAQFPIWGEFTSLFAILARTPFAEWPDIAGGCWLSNLFATRLAVTSKAHREELKRQDIASKKTIADLQQRLKDTERLLRNKMKQGEAKLPTEEIGAASPDFTDLERALSEQRKTNLRNQQRLDEQEAALNDARSLLDSLISHPAVSETDAQTMSMEEIRQLRGVIIGGHQLFINKLRKIMPNCLFYSADHRRLDEAAVRDRAFILFFTGYLNHSLSDIALRLARQNAIPCGYSEHVNLEMFANDVAKVMGRTLHTAG